MTTVLENIGTIDYTKAADIIDSIGESSERSTWRKKSAQRFINLPLPGKPDESWRRLRLSPVMLNRDIHSAEIEMESLPQGVKVFSLDNLQNQEEKLFQEYIDRYTQCAALRTEKDKKRANDVKENKFLSLNKAFSRQGLFIYADREVKTEEVLTLRIRLRGNKAISLPQVHLWAKEGSSGQIFIEYITEEGSKNILIPFTTGVVEKSANWEVLNNQDLDDSSQIYIFDSYFIQEQAQFNSYIFSQGAKQSFVDGHYTLQGKQSRFVMYGISTAKEKQVQGEKLSVEHHAPETVSDTSFRCVLFDKATSIFTGNIKIPKGSFKSEGYEENKNLILGDDCFTQAIPQLEIIENDVKCSHGATVSSTEPEDLFFLMARGLTQKAAEELLIRSFYRDILDKMPILQSNEVIKSRIYSLTAQKTGLNLNKNVYNWEE